MSLKHVLTPIKIGPVEVPNRVVRTGHGTGLGGGTLNDRLIDYHVARARGGVGLTVIEVISAQPTVYPLLQAGAPGMAEGYRKLMEQVRPFGMRVFQQIGHLGHENFSPDGSPPLSSSDTVGAMLGTQSQAMSHEQIGDAIASFVKVAEACVEGGLDGVELHMAHGYLVQQFLSPVFNRRDDEYGGSFENRIRLAVELLRAVRQVLPASMALGVRLSSDQFEGGMTPGDIAAIASEFERLGLIDYVNLSIGTNHNPHKIIGAMHEAAGYELPHALPVRQAVSLPLMVAGRFRTLEEADQVIGAGEADLVAMTRAHIADPDIVRKTIEGRVEDVRPCIGCNHGCIGGLLTAGQIGCTVNPAVGQEAHLAEDLIQPVASPKTVLVVGGGPAGMEAARVAALKGHRVILAEASGHLGGCVAIAKRAPRRMGIGDITDWLERQVYNLGVDVRLGTYVQHEDVCEIAPDVVIVATGSLPRLDGYQYLSPGRIADGMNRGNVVSSHDLLMAASNRDWGQRAIVYDDTGHYEGIAAAEFLMEKGLSVTFVTGQTSFAPRLEPSHAAIPALERLAKGNRFRLITYGRLAAIGESETRIELHYGGEPIVEKADTVVFVSHNMANRELLDALGTWPGKVMAAGDVLSPRYLQTAIREGHLAARSID